MMNPRFCLVLLGIEEGGLGHALGVVFGPQLKIASEGLLGLVA